MRKPLATLITSALAMVAMPAMAEDEAEPLPFRYTLRSDWTVNQYGKDTRNCWNTGTAADCSQAPTELEGETEGRIMYDRDINDNWTFKAQLGAEANYNNGWYEHGSRSTSTVPATGVRPPWVTQLVDTWVGFQHEDYGTIRVGTGLNPYQEAAGQTEGNAQFGGREYLERMVAYDSPLLFGDSNNGMSMKAAIYDGSRHRKAKYELAVEDYNSAARTRGIALVLSGKLATKFDTKLGLYNEISGSRSFYGTGPLDGDYIGTAFQESDATVTSYAGNGSLVTSRGLALDVAYNAGSYKVGAAVAFARRLRNEGLNNTTFASNGFGTGYASDAVSVYYSTWRGAWSMWAKASLVEFRLTDPNLLTSTSDWLYSNATYNYTSVTGELAYALNSHVRWVIGGTVMAYDFKESPRASGMCAEGKTTACYDPKGAKIYTGIRSNF